MKNVVKGMMAAAVAVGSVFSASNDTQAADVTINGAGASFPAPVYRKWLYLHKQETGTTINYQSVGSGAGIRQISAKTVDFGASDAPLTLEDLNKKGMIQFPMLMGGIVPVVNIPGIKPGELVLSPTVIADIFLGKIKNWSNEQIAQLNPSLKLPSKKITIVHRSDGSGTSWIFTNYLSKVSQEWADGPGCGKAIRWPVGIGGQKNPGVANNVMKVKGAIGYVEYTYASEANMSYVALINKDGKTVQPRIETFQAAGANADWNNAPGFYMVLTDQVGEQSWPITGVTYILVYKDQPNMAKKTAMFEYFNWCYTKGSITAAEMNYVGIPASVVRAVKSKWQSEIGQFTAAR